MDYARAPANVHRIHFVDVNQLCGRGSLPGEPNDATLRFADILLRVAFSIVDRSPTRR